MGKHITVMQLFGTLLLLTSCAELVEEHQLPNGFNLYRSKSYSLAIPLGYSYSETAPSGKYFYFGYPQGTPNGMSIIELHDNVKVCSPTITGASQTKPIKSTNGNTIWGKVDVWEKFGEGDIPDWENVICKKDGIPRPAEVYALCSEKDGKRVLICISQMTDNPQLAEEIFGTFRWED